MTLAYAQNTDEYGVTAYVENWVKSEIGDYGIYVPYGFASPW